MKVVQGGNKDLVGSYIHNMQARSTLSIFINIPNSAKHDYSVFSPGIHAMCDSSGRPLAGGAWANVLQCEGVGQNQAGM